MSTSAPPMKRQQAFFKSEAVVRLRASLPRNKKQHPGSRNLFPSRKAASMTAETPGVLGQPGTAAFFSLIEALSLPFPIRCRSGDSELRFSLQPVLLMAARVSGGWELLEIATRGVEVRAASRELIRLGLCPAPAFRIIFAPFCPFGRINVASAP